jgi:anthranilate phosphoribosyltransferase
VLVNAAAALLAAGVVSDLREAMQRAMQSVDSGAAWEKVRRLADFTSASERETKNEKRETGN